MTSNSNKTNYCFERLNDFYGEIHDRSAALPYRLISDGTFLWEIAEDEWCNDCFLMRYLAFTKRRELLGDEAGLRPSQEPAHPECFAEQNVSKGQDEREQRACSILLQIQIDQIDRPLPLVLSGRRSVSGDGRIEGCNPSGHTFFCYERCPKFVPHKHTSPPDKAVADIIEERLQETFGGLIHAGVFSHDAHTQELLGGVLATVLTQMPLAASPMGESLLCSGVGRTADEARTKAYMEFLERTALRNQVVRGARSEKPRASDMPHAEMAPFLALLSPAFDREKTDEDLWSRGIVGRDMLAGTDVLVPHGYLFPPRGELSCLSGSGSAAHTDRAEAEQRSLLELIERDAFMRWWLRPETAQKITPKRVHQKRMQVIMSIMRDVFGATDCVFSLYALPSPLDVPVIMALLSSQSTEVPPGLLIGASAALNGEDAASKALSELASSVLNMCARLQQGGAIAPDAAHDFSSLRTATDHSALYFHPLMGGERLPFLPLLHAQKEVAIAQKTRTFAAVRQQLIDAKMHWYTVDMTPDIARDCAVVIRSIVPELYPLTFGFPLPFDTSARSAFSVAEILPHPFP